MERKQATLAEIYAVLNQLVESYTDVMKMFQGVVVEVGDIKQAVGDIQAFVNNAYTDAVQTARVWQDAAQAHRLQAEDLRDKLRSIEAAVIKSGRVPDERPPSDFRVYVDNKDEDSHLMVVDESLDTQHGER